MLTIVEVLNRRRARILFGASMFSTLPALILTQVFDKEETHQLLFNAALVWLVPLYLGFTSRRWPSRSLGAACLKVPAFAALEYKTTQDAERLGKFSVSIPLIAFSLIGPLPIQFYYFSTKMRANSFYGISISAFFLLHVYVVLTLFALFYANEKTKGHGHPFAGFWLWLFVSAASAITSVPIFESYDLFFISALTYLCLPPFYFYIDKLFDEERAVLVGNRGSRFSQ